MKFSIFIASENTCAYSVHAAKHHYHFYAGDTFPYEKFKKSNFDFQCFSRPWKQKSKNQCFSRQRTNHENAYQKYLPWSLISSINI